MVEGELPKPLAAVQMKDGAKEAESGSQGISA